MSEEPRNAFIKASKGVVDAAVHGSDEPFVEVYVLSKPGLQKTLEKYPAIQDALEEDAWQKRSQQEAFLSAEMAGGDEDVVAHVLAEGYKQVALQKGKTGFGMQIDRSGFVLSYGCKTPSRSAVACEVQSFVLTVAFDCSDPARSGRGCWH